MSRTRSKKFTRHVLR
ncbi:hypothetical protein [Porphyromonas gingivalis]